MPESDKTLSLQIVLDLLAAGQADEARQKLAELKQSGADLSQETGVINVSGADVEKTLGGAGDRAELTQRTLRRLAKALGAEIAAAASVMEAEDNARKGIAGREIENMEQRGVVSHATALKMKEQLDLQYEQQKLIRMKAQDQLEISELQRQEASREIEDHKLTGHKSAAEAKYKDAARATATNDQKVKGAPDPINAGESAGKASREKGVADDGDQRLRDKITEMAATNAIKEAGAPAELEMNRANAALGADQATADAVFSGTALSQAGARKLIQDASAIAGHQVDLQTAAQIIENGANNLGMFMNQVQALARALSRLNPAQTAQLQQQIDTIKAQLAAGGMNFGG